MTFSVTSVRGDDSFIWRLCKDYSCFFVIFLFWFFVALCVPEGGDDWEIANWYAGTDSLKGVAWSWRNFNGRVSTNLFTALFSYHRTLWYVESAFIHTFTLFLISKLLKFDKNKLAILAAFLGSIMLSNGFRAEIQFHLVANVAYTICACGMFALIYMLERNYKGRYFLRNRIFNFVLWAILGIINHFKLPENTRLYFDDGLSANSILIEIDHGTVLAEIDQYIKTGESYIYEFSLHKDGVPIKTVEEKISKCKFNIDESGQYQVFCTVINQNTQKQKSLASEIVQD